MDTPDVPPKGYDNRPWLKHWEVVKFLDKFYTPSCIKQLRKKCIIETMQPYEGSNYLYSKKDVFKLRGWV